MSNPADLRAALDKADGACNECTGLRSCQSCEPLHTAIREAVRAVAEFAAEFDTNLDSSMMAMRQELDSILGERKEGDK